jgi:phosphoglycolate phosphatase
MNNFDFLAINTIVWDWNGTLLDDRDICIQSMNDLLRQRGLPLLTRERYLKVFNFPVKDYYQALGFDFKQEPFDVPALQFMDNYHQLLPNALLFDEVKATLAFLKERGYRQVVLSAMEQKSLVQSIRKLGIYDYFEAIAGIEDHFAHGKIDRGRLLFERLGLSGKNCLLIGDTLHDEEVASELDCSCALVANGHQSKERLMVNGNVVVSSLKELLALLPKV